MIILEKEKIIMKTPVTSEKNDFEFLFKKHYQLLCLVSFAILKDRDASKDIVQDFFISYWQKRNSISLRVSFQAYAVKAVKNLSLLSLKKIENEKLLLQNLNKDEYYTQKSWDKPIISGNKITEVLNKLPPKRREIFISFALQGNSYREIAEYNGISINTVKTQIKRAYAFLKSHAKEDFIYLLILSNSLNFI